MEKSVHQVLWQAVEEFRVGGTKIKIMAIVEVGFDEAPATDDRADGGG